LGTVRPWTLKLKIRVLLISVISANRKLVVWVGGLDSWDSLIKGIGILRGIQFESQTTRIPNHQLTIGRCILLQNAMNSNGSSTGLLFFCLQTPTHFALGISWTGWKLMGIYVDSPPSLGLEPYHGVKRWSSPYLICSHQIKAEKSYPHRLPAKTPENWWLQNERTLPFGAFFKRLLSGAFPRSQTGLSRITLNYFNLAGAWSREVDWERFWSCSFGLDRHSFMTFIR